VGPLSASVAGVVPGMVVRSQFAPEAGVRMERQRPPVGVGGVGEMGRGAVILDGAGHLPYLGHEAAPRATTPRVVDLSVSIAQVATETPSEYVLDMLSS
jgi:hypothetical protein